MGDDWRGGKMDSSGRIIYPAEKNLSGKMAQGGRQEAAFLDRVRF